MRLRLNHLHVFLTESLSSVAWLLVTVYRYTDAFLGYPRDT